MTKQQSGFTLIELVLVIVILGILAATALPRFSDLSTQACVASLNGLAGSIRSAASIARATQLAQGLAPGTSVVLDGQTVQMASGYPRDDNANGMDLALQDVANLNPATVGSARRYTIKTNASADYDNSPTGLTGFTVSIISTGC